MFAVVEGLALQPQWSPVNVTGNTTEMRAECPTIDLAAMEPGERHREHTVERPRRRRSG